MTPEMLAVLKTELQADPAARGYVGQSAQTKADLLNASYVVMSAMPAPRWVDTLVTEVEKVIVPSGEMFAISRLASRIPTDTVPPTPADQAIALAWSFNQIINRWEKVETSSDVVRNETIQVLNGLHAAGVLSAISLAAIEVLFSAQAPAAAVEHHPRIMQIFIDNPIEGAPNFVTAADVGSAV